MHIPNFAYSLQNGYDSVIIRSYYLSFSSFNESVKYTPYKARAKKDSPTTNFTTMKIDEHLKTISGMAKTLKNDSFQFHF